MPSLSFIATANVVRYVGATPVFADVDLATRNLTPDTIEAGASRRRTRAVMLVHQVGSRPTSTPYTRCATRGHRVIEDAACATGSTYKGAPDRRALRPRRLLVPPAQGDHHRRGRDARHHRRGLGRPGAPAPRARDVVERRRPPRARRRRAREYDEVGFNYRMTDVQAAIGLVQLGRLDAIVARRRELAPATTRARRPPARGTADRPARTADELPVVLARAARGFPVARRAPGSLRRRGLGPTGDHGVAPRARLRGDAPHRLPVTERLTRASLILPLFHEMTDAEHDFVIDVIKHTMDGDG